MSSESAGLAWTFRLAIFRTGRAEVIREHGGWCLSGWTERSRATRLLIWVGTRQHFAKTFVAASTACTRPCDALRERSWLDWERCDASLVHAVARARCSLASWIEPLLSPRLRAVQTRKRRCTHSEQWNRPSMLSRRSYRVCKTKKCSVRRMRASWPRGKSSSGVRWRECMHKWQIMDTRSKAKSLAEAEL